MPFNGKTKLVFWLASGLLSCITTGMILLTTNVIANDKTNTTEHKEIRQELQICLNDLRKEVKADINGVKMDIKATRMEILEAIKNK